MNRVLLLAVVLSAGCELFGGSGSGDGGPSRKNCTQSSDCGAGMLCAGGECKMEGFAGPGARCGTTKECGGGLFCAPTGTCVPAGTATVGDACTSDATCQKGLRCDLRGFGGVCVQGGGAEAGQPCGKSFDCTPGLFCGDGQLCQPFPIAFPPFPGVVCLPDEARFHSFFELPRPGKYPSDFFRMPFPDDARVKKDGMLDLTDFARPGPTPLGIDLVQIYVDAWAKQFAGFGTTTAATFRFSKELDFATATGDAIQLIDLTKGPTFGQPLGRGWGYTTGRNKWSCQHPFTVRSGVESPLLPRHTYGAILLTALASGKGLKGKDGTSPAPDPDLLALLGAMRPAGDEALGSAWDVHAPLREWLTAQKIPSSSVANAALFTVQDATGGMGKLAASVAASPAPVLSDLTLCDAGVKSPCDDGTPARACPAANPDFHEIHGRFTIPIYQAGTAPYLTPQSGGGIVFENGTPKLQRTEGVCFALTVPKKGTQPANGWPLTVYHHGTGGSLRSLAGIAPTLAKGALPSATFSFDAVEHGARRGASMEKADNLVFNALNPDAARDNFLQGGVDILQALRVAGVTLPAGKPLPAEVRFNPKAVSFFGHSQGATSGALAMAFATGTEVAVFSGAGAFLTDSLLSKTSPVNIAAGMRFLLGDEIGPDHPVMTIFQSFFERSDPINYNPLLLRTPPMGVPSKHVYMSYGPGDTYSPPVTLQHNADSLGLPLAAPKLEPKDDPKAMRPVKANFAAGDGKMRTAAYFKYMPAGYDGHFVAEKNPQAIADWSGFLQTWLATGTPEIK